MWPRFGLSGGNLSALARSGKIGGTLRAKKPFLCASVSLCEIFFYVSARAKLARLTRSADWMKTSRASIASSSSWGRGG